MFADTVRCVEGTTCHTSDGSYVDNGAAILDVVQLCTQTSKSPVQIRVQYIIHHSSSDLFMTEAASGFFRKT